MRKRQNISLIAALIGWAALGTTELDAHWYKYYDVTGVVHAPQAVRDPTTGVILYVESDGRHIAALTRQGRLLWTRNPYEEAGLPPYRTKVPRISTIWPSSSCWKEDSRPRKSRTEHCFFVKFDSTTTFAVNEMSGDVRPFSQD
jgi:hypothetical protein